jgi:hypothetical protein
MSLTGQPLLTLLITLAILIPLITEATLPRPPRGLLRPILGFVAMVLAQLLAVAAVGCGPTTHSASMTAGRTSWAVLAARPGRLPRA